MVQMGSLAKAVRVFTATLQRARSLRRSKSAFAVSHGAQQMLTLGWHRAPLSVEQSKIGTLESFASDVNCRAGFEISVDPIQFTAGTATVRSAGDYHRANKSPGFSMSEQAVDLIWSLAQNAPPHGTAQTGPIHYRTTNPNGFGRGIRRYGLFPAIRRPNSEDHRQGQGHREASSVPHGARRAHQSPPASY
jgi:hypothetical protein